MSIKLYFIGNLSKLIKISAKSLLFIYVIYLISLTTNNGSCAHMKEIMLYYIGRVSKLIKNKWVYRGRAD